MDELLFVNACVRGPKSRTERLARALLAQAHCPVTELRLDAADIRPLTAETLARRDALLKAGRLDDPMLAYARQLAAARRVLIAAPYWDFSFPAALKCWVEAVCVDGVTFRYENDRPVGLCRAEQVTYVTTAGGPIGDRDFGFDYIRGVMGGLLGIPAFHRVAAEGLDIVGCDVEAVLRETLRAEL